MPPLPPPPRIPPKPRAVRAAHAVVPVIPRSTHTLTLLRAIYGERAVGKSTEQIAIEALRAVATSDRGTPTKKRDLSDLAGGRKEHPECDQLMLEQDQIDQKDV